MLQQFLGDVLIKVHGDNFVPATSHYSQGDLKCDGLLWTPLTVYACYGPQNGGQGLSAQALRKAVAKVESDYMGAVKHWPKLEVWQFVSNFVDGIPPQITQQILNLQGLTQDRQLKQFGKEQFEAHIFSLPLVHIEELVGDAATDDDFRNVQIPEIQTLVDEIIAKVSDDRLLDDTPIEVPSAKLEFNALPEVYHLRLMQGLPNARRVAHHLQYHPDPTLDRNIASIFKAKYVEYKSQGLASGQIMDDLYDFALGGQPPKTPREVAVWSLLAHLFEKCTIFEDDPSKVGK